MFRRRVVALLGTSTAASISGCVDQSTLIAGVDETLEIRSEFDEAVALDIRIEQDEVNEDGRVVFDETVTVDANETRTLDVLGDDQYYLAVSGNGETHEFGTRPICDRAFTRIIVTADGGLDSEIEDCE